MKRTTAIVIVLTLTVLPLASCEQACGRKDIVRYHSDGSVDKCVVTHDDPQPHWSRIKDPK